MFHGLTDHTLGATTSCILLVTGAALALIVYAAVIFVDLLATPSAQDLLRFVSN